MHFSQKLGGAAALLEAVAYLVGIVVGFTVLAPFMSGELDPGETVAFLAGHRAILYAWNQIILVGFGLVLVVLALALHARLKAGAPALMQVATALGFIWAGLALASGMIFNVGTSVVVDLRGSDPAQAGSVRLAIAAVQDGLGGGNEIVGGAWTLLVSWAALRAGGLSRALNYLGVLVGAAGLITIIPALGEPGGIIFGLGQLIWFVWLGIAMLRGGERLAVHDAGHVRAATRAHGPLDARA